MTDHASRRDAAYEATLAAIDDATDRRCSQCHEPLPEDSASEWWCDPPDSPYVVSCQEAWYQDRATDPDDVLDREDAAEVLVGRDAARVALNDQHQRMSAADRLQRLADCYISATEDTEQPPPRGLSPIENAVRQMAATVVDEVHVWNANDPVQLPARVRFPDGSERIFQVTYNRVGDGQYEAVFNTTEVGRRLTNSGGT